MKRIEHLEGENRSLIQFSSGLDQLRSSKSQRSPQYQVLYRISKAGTFLGEPSWIFADDRKLSLKGELPLSRPSRYLEKHSEIILVIYKDYSLPTQSVIKLRAKLEDEDFIPPPRPKAESLKLVSSDMVEAVKAFFARVPDFKESFPGHIWTNELQAPYLFWYRYRASYHDIITELQPHHRRMMEFLVQWIEHNYGQEYEDADNRLRNGYISRRLMKYYVMPGDVLVSRKNGDLQTYMAETWTIDQKSNRTWDDDDDDDEGWEEQTREIREFQSDKTRAVRPRHYNVSGWSYQFDGTFSKKRSHLRIELKLDQRNDEVKILDMEIFPLKLATQDLLQKLERRGKIFWKCRYKMFVSYRMNSVEGLTSVSLDSFLI